MYVSLICIFFILIYANTDIELPLGVLEQMRYRFDDVMRNVTPNAISSAQLQAISKSALTSSKLKDYFETNRGDFDALQIYASQTVSYK